MRLYLSSYRLGDSAGALLALLGSGAHAAIIANAVDHIAPADRAHYSAKAAYDLAAFGIGSVELDLRDYFGRPEALEAALADIDLVWVTGGNAFLLRRAMARSGFDTLIRRLLETDALVYGGFSAGAVVAGPSLAGVELIDPPDVIADGYDAAPITEGLGLIDYAIVPHFASPHPEAPQAGLLARHYARRKTPFRALRDGEVIVHIGQIPEIEELAS